MKSFIKDKSGQTGMLTFFIGAMIAVIIALQVAWPVIDQSIYGSGGYATNVFNFTGNSTEGQRINITTAGISNSGDGSNTMCYYFNTSGIGKPVGCLVVDVRSGANTSTGSATALAASINGDTDFAPWGTAAASTTFVTITADKAGNIYNWPVSETVTNGAFSKIAAFTGGAFGGILNMGSAASTIVEQIPLFLVLILLMVFIKAVI